MVKAEELLKQQKERDERKKITYNKIYELLEKKITMASSTNNNFTWYQIPEFLVGLPLYSLDGCKKYILRKLKKNGFETEYFEPNILLVKWFAKK